MKKEKPPVKNFVARKSKRVHLKIRFKVSGRDQFGNQFEDHIETTDVGSSGGSFPTKWEIRVGATLKLTGPKGFVSLVRVVWVKEDFKTRSPDGWLSTLGAPQGLGVAISKPHSASANLPRTEENLRRYRGAGGARCFGAHPFSVTHSGVPFPGAVSAPCPAIPTSGSLHS